MSLPSFFSKNSFNLERAFKQFSLETERLEMTYQNLQDRFKEVQSTLEDSRTRLAGKLAELDFASRYLEAILHHMSQGILFIDMQGVVTTYNLAAQRLLRIPEKELLFHSLTDFFEDRFLGFSLQQAFETQKCPRTSFVSCTIQERKLELEVEATFVLMSQQAYPLSFRQSPSAPIQGLLILLRDVTKMRRLQQMAYHHDRLKELGELAAHLAHEIRNPLGGIKGFANLLQQELTERADLQQMASYIAQGADDLNQLVTQILFYAKPSHPQLEMVDVKRLIEEVRQLLQADATWNAQTLFRVEGGQESLVVPLDPQLFKTALLNLCVNALQAMPSGGTLEIKIESTSSEVILFVQDTGSGIAPEHLSQIFSPFFTTKSTGTGLGLAEVYQVIQGHHGSIDVESEPGKGTLFIIKIPLKVEE